MMDEKNEGIGLANPDFDPVSYAAVVGSAAATDFYDLTRPDLSDVGGSLWFELAGHPVPEGGRSPGQAEAYQADLRDAYTRLAAYVCERGIDREETAWIFATLEQLIDTEAERFADEPLDRRTAFKLFVQTARTVHDTLKSAQTAAQWEASRPAPETLKREDSIFEDDEPMDALTDAAKEQAENDKARAKLQKAADAKRKALDKQTTAASETARPKRSAASKAAGKGTAKKPEPLSAGTPMAKKPANRGGRGRKKSSAAASKKKTG
ncbi:MAG: hypothetical protein AAF468_22225 [Pseudomonadota bacterium]